jgi:hypothetical protein
MAPLTAFHDRRAEQVLVDLELKRRTNNKRIDALYNRMGSMMASLKPLLETDRGDLSKILPLLDKIGVSSPFIIDCLCLIQPSVHRMICLSAETCWMSTKNSY